MIPHPMIMMTYFVHIFLFLTLIESGLIHWIPLLSHLLLYIIFISYRYSSSNLTQFNWVFVYYCHKTNSSQLVTYSSFFLILNIIRMDLVYFYFEKCVLIHVSKTLHFMLISSIAMWMTSDRLTQHTRMLIWHTWCHMVLGKMQYCLKLWYYLYIWRHNSCI